MVTVAIDKRLGKFYRHVAIVSQEPRELGVIVDHEVGNRLLDEVN